MTLEFSTARRRSPKRCSIENLVLKMTVCALMIGLGGCILLPAHKAYDGNVPKDQLVRLSVYDAGNFQNPGPHAVEIVELNGKRFKMTDDLTHSNTYLVAAGEVKIVFRCSDHRSDIKAKMRQRNSMPAERILKVEPGEKYALGCRLNWDASRYTYQHSLITQRHY